ncbi:3722_t:CDS:2, partial [Dentiscutata heterogama]
VTLVQMVPISSSQDDYVLTPEDLPSSSPLLIYTATVVPISYIPDNQGGRESFVMARWLYNRVTNNKNVESKTVMSVIERLKIGSKKLPYILASNIEWTYVSSDFQPSSTTSNTRVTSEVELDVHLDSIEEKYATLTSQLPQKKPRINLHNPLDNKHLNDKTTSLNFADLILQIQKGPPSAGTTYAEPFSSTANYEDDTLINDNDSIEPSHVQPQNTKPDTKGKRARTTKK